MGAKRYTTRQRENLTGTGGRGGQVRKPVWVVWDTVRLKVAKGTTGDGRPGGYATEHEARLLADKMNRDLDAALKAKRERERRSK